MSCACAGIRGLSSSRCAAASTVTRTLCTTRPRCPLRPSLPTPLCFFVHALAVTNDGGESAAFVCSAPRCEEGGCSGLRLRGAEKLRLSLPPGLAVKEIIGGRVKAAHLPFG
eukprot:1784762-Rhodomonas_salina.1